jgi:hypothetical protein
MKGLYRSGSLETVTRNYQIQIGFSCSTGDEWDKVALKLQASTHSSVEMGKLVVA